MLRTPLHARPLQLARLRPSPSYSYCPPTVCHRYRRRFCNHCVLGASYALRRCSGCSGHMCPLGTEAALRRRRIPCCRCRWAPLPLDWRPRCVAVPVAGRCWWALRPCGALLLLGVLRVAWVLLLLLVRVVRVRVPMRVPVAVAAAHAAVHRLQRVLQLLQLGQLAGGGLRMTQMWRG